MLTEEKDVENRICLPCDPRRRLHRYLMIFFICFICFGNYFCYDNPAALQDSFLTVLNMDMTAFMKMYSIYSWPNLILAFIGGYLIDNVFGLRWGAFIFASIIFISQLVFATGVYTNTLWVIYLGRFLYGIGGESLCVAQDTYCTSWFPVTEINFIFGLQLSISRLGSSVNMNVMDKLYKYIANSSTYTGPKALGISLFIAALTCFYSLTCSGIMVYFDMRREKILGISKDSPTTHDEKEVKESGKMGFSLKEILQFPSANWSICLICIFFYSSVIPFIAVGQNYFEKKFHCTIEYASLVNSMVYIVSTAACPIIGTLIGCTGKNVFWLGTGISVTLGCQCMFAFIPVGMIPPIALTIAMGFSYSIMSSSLWPMIAMVLPSKYHGTAYGIAQSSLNLGLALSMHLIGIIIDSKGYFYLELTLIAFLSVSLIGAAHLFYWDRRNGGKLNQSAKERKRQEEKEACNQTLL